MAELLAVCPQCHTTVTGQQILADGTEFPAGEWHRWSSLNKTLTEVGVRLDPCGHVLRVPVEARRG